MVVTIHHLNKSRSHRIVWLLEEIGIPYEIKKYERTSEGLAPKELLDIHPLGKVPVITDDGRTVAETGAIVEYLVSKYAPKLAPPASDEDATLRFKYWLHFAEGSAMLPVLLDLLFSMTVTKAPFFIRPIASMISSGVHRFYIGPNFKRQTEYMEAELAKNPENWFVKDFTAADIILSFPIEATEKRLGLEPYPHLRKYLDTIHARAAYKRAEERGGKLTLM